MTEGDHHEGGGRKKPGPKPDPAKAKKVFVNIRCRSEWRDWLNGYAESRGVDVSQLVDEALLKMARSDGYGAMPPER